MKNSEIENNYTYHAPKEGQPERYERIRSMTDEELAYFMANIEPCRESAWLDWLKQEVVSDG